MSVGRPTKYKDEYCEQAQKLTLLGAIDTQLADFFNVNESTIYLWKKEHPEFSEALNAGKEESDNQVVKSLFQRALGYSHKEEKVFLHQGEIVTHKTIKHYPPDATSMIFWLKNRQKIDWRDRQELEHTGKDGAPIEIDSVSDVEMARRLAYILTAGADSATH